ncbi:MAG: glycosyltransferase [Candidatus Omnitrophota bacterium]
MAYELDILIPTCDRPAALAATLSGLCSQSRKPFRLMISDQTSDLDVMDSGEIRALLRVLQAQGNAVSVHKHLPKRGMAEQRQFLLGLSEARYCLFLDDDLLLEPDILERLMKTIHEEECGFVGAAPIGLSYLREERPQQQAIEFWEGPVEPETVVPHGPRWRRHVLHNAANIYHVQRRLGLGSGRQKKYKVAWIGGCILYDRRKLEGEGGYGFWTRLPKDHCGEDVLVQLRLMSRYGGCGIIPSGVYHLELPTTVKERRVNAAEAFFNGSEFDFQREQGLGR